MCYPEKCPKCGKTGWAGCGRHVDEVMRSIPASQRCTCNRDPTPKSEFHEPARPARKWFRRTPEKGRQP